MRRTIISTILLAGLISATAYASDWAQFRGPNANGISTETGISKDWNSNPPKMLWKTAMTDDGYAGPSVAGGKVFIIDHKGQQDIVRAIDIKTGEDIWQYKYPDAAKENYGFSKATPVAENNRVYTSSWEGIINCLDATTGKPIWTRDVFTDFKGKKPNWLYAWSLLLDGNKVIACPGGLNAAMVALDKKTGATIWAGGGSDPAGYVTPIIATIGGKRQYVLLTGVSLIGVDPDNGKLLWSQPWKTPMAITGAEPIVIGNSIFVTSGYKFGCGLVEVKDGATSLKYQNKDMQCRFSSPILLGGYVYGVSEPDPGSLTCMDPMTGVVKWRKPGFDFGGMICVDGVLLVLDGKSGIMTMVKPAPDSYRQLGTFTPIGGQSWTAPIVSDGNLIVRTKDTLACFSLK
jgi:outer membrane protein assembly factor BamB